MSTDSKNDPQAYTNNNDSQTYDSFDKITERLDEIVVAVRDKDTSLERCLDLFDEALELGGRAVDMIDTTSFSAEERASSEVK